MCRDVSASVSASVSADASADEKIYEFSPGRIDVKATTQNVALLVSAAMIITDESKETVQNKYDQMINRLKQKCIQMDSREPIDGWCVFYDTTVVYQMIAQ